VSGAVSLLSAHWQRLGLAEYGPPERFSCVLLTPRFAASSHVVFLVMPKDGPEPVFVAKVPRLVGANTSVAREAAVLRAIQASRHGGFSSVPRPLAFEAHEGWQILIETALVGEPLDPRAVRRDLGGCCEAVTEWLLDIQHASPVTTNAEPGWLDRLIERPLRGLSRAMQPGSVDEVSLLARTREVIAPLQGACLPLVIEHGDLSHPNIVLLKNGGIGVVDWELADPRGLPGCDLFFFLTYVAFATRKSGVRGGHVAAFRDAFFGSSAWARPYIEAYAHRLALPERTLAPLFVLTWTRYLAGLLIRMRRGQLHRPLEPETAAWLRTNRYYLLWQHAVTHLDELCWH
jgi:aminoglycoside phosphotransferase (APT) family kinase protein